MISILKKLPENKTNEALLEEHSFIANCLKIGLKIEDLKQLQYKDVAKIMLCFIEKEEPNKRKATKADWDILAGGR